MSLRSSRRKEKNLPRTGSASRRPRSRATTSASRSGAKTNLFKACADPTHCELKLAVENRVGLIKDISAVIARSHTGILSFHSDDQKGNRYAFDKVDIQMSEKAKIEKLIMKLKVIPGVKEVSYRLI